MPTKNSPPRYLALDKIFAAGFKHVLGELSFFVATAAIYGRTLAIPTFVPASWDNAGHKLPATAFGKYLDLRRSGVEITTPDGVVSKLPIGDLGEQDLGDLKIDQAQVLRLKDLSDLFEYETDGLGEYSLVRAGCSPHGMYLKLMSGCGKADSFSYGFRRSDGTRARVVWRPSRRALEMAAAAKAKLGSDRFAVVHLRQGHFYNAVPHYRQLVNPKTMAAKMKKVLPRDLPVYLMTDERDQHRLTPLHREFDLTTCDDIKQMRAVIAPLDGSTPDNFLVYVAELWLQRAATVEIHSCRPIPFGTRFKPPRRIHRLYDFHPVTLVGDRFALLRRTPNWLFAVLLRLKLTNPADWESYGGSKIFGLVPAWVRPILRLRLKLTNPADWEPYEAFTVLGLVPAWARPILRPLNRIRKQVKQTLRGGRRTD